MNKTNKTAHANPLLLTPLSIALLAAFPSLAAAVGPDACIGQNFTGSWPGGISVVNVTANRVLDIYDLTAAIEPASGIAGVLLTSQSGANLSACTAAMLAPIRISTANASGIVVASTGRPPVPATTDPLFGIAMPGGAAAQGGAVLVVNRMDVTTSGTNAHGVHATSNTDGYPSTMVDALKGYDVGRIGFDVTSVATPEGTAASAGTAVAARVVETEQVGDKTHFVGYGIQAGTFNIGTDGTVGFAISAADFTALDLAVGEKVTVTVDVLLQGKRDGVSQGTQAVEKGRVSAQITKDTNGNAQVVATWADFDTFGQTDLSTAGTKALPDVAAYLAAKVAEAEGAGGGGNSVRVEHLAGTIATGGAAAHGLLAESRGRDGTRGRDGGGFWSFGFVPPRSGTPGKNGGAVDVVVDGTIRTTHEAAADAAAATAQAEASIGALAHSAGGRGGDGGGGGTYYYGRAGANGGDGNVVTVTGSGTITTEGRYASGILAISEGGDGGNGGGGDIFTGGGPGSSGGKGGEVRVSGIWSITTTGADAHGIWAKSTGGDSGAGGKGGWIAGAAAPGAVATDGGKVTIESGGAVTTHGDDAFALFGQSVGGFGGSGGQGRNLFSSRGGSGGSAGSGGEVSVTNEAAGTLTTSGTGAHAIVAQSIGGGGGAGGSSSGIVARGGSGAYGGDGKAVEAANHGEIHTWGERAFGLLAQSIGGGGGDGGDAAGLGAFGGAASDTSKGGTVSVTNSGRIETERAGSTAIYAQSIGGGGGNGGSSTGWFSVGGSGGGGGDADTVTVHQSGTLVTRQNDATALFAQSVGGGGGRGGASVAAGAFGAFSLGGSGAGGGKGANVVVDSTAGTIETHGEHAYGIYAQSLGGGGGDGGFAMAQSTGLANLAMAVGGASGKGGDAGDVRVVNAATIVTQKADSVGLFAESIGGGGGNGGFAIANATGGAFSASFSLGGSGAGGGVGKTTWIENAGAITTAGDRSMGLQAQSIGGGGGNGGFSLGVATGGLGAVTMSLGGTAGGGGTAELVHVENGARIGTDGVGAHAMLVQSIGGGGGTGGFSVGVAAGGFGAGTLSLGGTGGTGGNAGAVYVDNDGALATNRSDSVGLFAQSIGGGGGSGGFALSGTASAGVAMSFGLGGSGAGGGDASTVTVLNDGGIATLGDKSIGLQAQSIGGGGGNGGFSLAAGGAGLGAVSLSLGGKAAKGGLGNEVHVENAGAITTDGIGAHAMFVQSIGGGGGNGGFSLALAGGGFAGASVGLGGGGGAGGAGGIVHVENGAALATHQRESVGLFAQSVGGGGGNGGFVLSGAGSGGVGVGFGLGGSGAGGGAGGTVTVINDGSIATVGDKSIGLQAQSIGGGGGNGGFSATVAGGALGGLSITLGGSAAGGGLGEQVHVVNRGAIGTDGVDAHAMFVQSVGGGGGNGGFSVGVAGGGFGAGTVTLGGTGGAGGPGGVVYAENTASLTTRKDNAVGLFAQSVGGGGGNGGFSIGAAGAGTAALAFNLGGKGDKGGDANTVTVLSHGDIATTGVDAHGVFAQSLGGGGGNGGFALTATGAGTASGAIGIGGWGDGGGDAKRVDVDQTGRIETRGDGAVGVQAQSVGGGGGNGGFSIAATGAGTVSGALTLGGSAGGGGAGGIVELTSDGTIVTDGAKAHGLFAQSVGGGGGNGGFAVAAAGAGTGSASIGIGGKAAKGGDGDAVTLNSAGSITTRGEAAVGLFAQSVGGGGGNGGFAFAGDAGSKLAAAVAVGGGGGAGGFADTVHVDSSSRIDTTGAGAHAIQAQSVGGGGGSGGMALTASLGAFTGSGVNASVTVGGSGGTGGRGGSVIVGNTASVTGALTTRGDGAHGVLAQSVGGGGGQGGAALALTFGTDLKLPESAKTLTATFTFGGGGGDGNVGGAVTVRNASAVATSGADSHGIFAQSVGGGGGSNGGADTISLSTSSLMPLKSSKATNLGLAIEAGGNAGNGNKGGAVTVTNDGAITTSGTSSRGILAQSIGGGGGSVTEGVLGKVGDWLDDAQNVLGAAGVAKTIYDAFNGDAGGLIPSSLSITLGSNEGNGADAGAVKVTNRADIATAGLSSHAIFAQSVGAGGGDAKAYAEGRGGGQSVDTSVGLIGEFVIGGRGGAAGSGGAVDVIHAGALATAGAQAHGIFAQSVGGGGGSAGNVAGGFSGIDSIGLGIGFGQSGGSGGNGGAVTVSSSGTIATHGERSIGILAQSVGGGGGSAGDRSGLAFFGSVGGYGSGGAVAVTHEGTIVTDGARAHGIFAQSTGGQTGSVTNAGGTSSYLGRGSTVDVTLRNGGVAANGALADGIAAQSLGVDGGAAITVTLDQAFVRGGSGNAAGVRLLDGASNQVINRGGWITTLDGLDGTAIIATGGNDSVRNAGLVTGNVDLGAGANAFVNEAGGQFDAGSSLHLGASGALTNRGLLSPRGSGAVGTTALDGDLVQDGSGALLVDLDVMDRKADRVVVGGKATLAGVVRLVATRPAPGQHRIAIVSAGQGVDASELAVDAARSAVARYTLTVEGKELLLDYRIDFSDVAGLSANQRRFGAHVNAIQAVGGTEGFAPIAAALFALPQAGELGDAYSHLGAEPHLALSSSTLLSSLQFGDAMLSCRRSDGEARFVREGDCGWAAATAGSLKQRSSAEGLGFRRSAGGVAGGFQREVAPDWHVGLAFGVEHAIVNTDGFATTRGDQVQGGVMLKWRRGGTTVSAGIAAGRGSYAMERSVTLPGGSVVASSDPRLNFATAHLRLGHAFERERWYLRPLVDVGATQVVQRAFDERGAGAGALSVLRSRQTTWTLRPALEIGGEWTRTDGSLLRPYLRAGALRLASGTPRISATLQGLPADIEPFVAESAMSRTIGELAAGIDLLDAGGTVLRFGYAGQFSGRIDAHAATLKVSMPF